MASHTGLRELFILRHAKSDHDQPDLQDFDRPLSERGRADAMKMGKWMQSQQLIPDCILTSPSKRTVQTIKRIKQCIDKEQLIPCELTDSIYEAELTDLLQLLAQVQPEKSDKLLIVGHNPGLENLLSYLTDKLCVDADSCVKLFPTCSLAHVVLPTDWSDLSPGCGRLINLWQVKNLPEDA